MGSAAVCLVVPFGSSRTAPRCCFLLLLFAPVVPPTPTPASRRSFCRWLARGALGASSSAATKVLQKAAVYVRDPWLLRELHRWARIWQLTMYMLATHASELPEEGLALLDAEEQRLYRQAPNRRLLVYLKIQQLVAAAGLSGTEVGGERMRRRRQAQRNTWVFLSPPLCVHYRSLGPCPTAPDQAPPGPSVDPPHRSAPRPRPWPPTQQIQIMDVFVQRMGAEGDSCHRLRFTALPYNLTLVNTGFLQIWLLLSPLAIWTDDSSGDWFGLLPFFFMTVMVLGTDEVACQLEDAFQFLPCADVLEAQGRACTQ